VARTRCVALLRGINVGGRNKVAMPDLRQTRSCPDRDRVLGRVELLAYRLPVWTIFVVASHPL